MCVPVCVRKGRRKGGGGGGGEILSKTYKTYHTDKSFWGFQIYVNMPSL